MFESGDFIEIPLPDGRGAIAWILLVSEQFKDTIGFIVFGIKGELQHDCFNSDRGAGFVGPYYTHARNLTDYHCKRTHHAPVSESKRLLTKRRVGCGIYVGDDYVGSVEDLKGESASPMLFMGMPAIIQQIEKAFPNEPRETP